MRYGFGSITIKWAHIDNTGGLDAAGKTRKTISVATPINVDIEDSWITGGEDDIVAMKGGAKITILVIRNTFTSNGSTDGECINIKTGVLGVVAFYNVIFSQSRNSCENRKQAIPRRIPQTSVDIYNNTAGFHADGEESA